MLHSVYPLFAVALAVLLSGALRYWSETRLRRRVSSLFARYVPPPVADELVRDGRLAAVVEGQRLPVTVFFCDLRGFAPLAASLSPSEVNQVLSEYYEHVSSRVLDHGGTIIQYVGDEVFAVFGAPVSREDHAAAALWCALQVQADAPALAASLAERSLPAVAFGIGLNTGEVVAAHAGSSFRRQYAVVGDPVNVGSRLCGQAAGGEVVAADETVADSGITITGERFSPLLKGVERAVVAWRIEPSRTAAGQGPR